LPVEVNLETKQTYISSVKKNRINNRTITLYKIERQEKGKMSEYILFYFARRIKIHYLYFL